MLNKWWLELRRYISISVHWPPVTDDNYIHSVAGYTVATLLIIMIVNRLSSYHFTIEIVIAQAYYHPLYHKKLVAWWRCIRTLTYIRNFRKCKHTWNWALADIPGVFIPVQQCWGKDEVEVLWQTAHFRFHLPWIPHGRAGLVVCLPRPQDLVHVLPKKRVCLHGQPRLIEEGRREGTMKVNLEPTGLQLSGLNCQVVCL